MSHVLVTGGFGAIGSWVTRTLVEQGHEATVLSRTADRSLVPDLGDEVRHVAGSIDDRDLVRRVLADHDVDRVVHCAAALGGAGERDPVSAYATNLMGSLHVFEAAREVGIQRIVYTSTKGVYGRLPSRYGAPELVPIGEDVEGAPFKVYGASKKALEGAAEQCRRLWGLEIIALRLGSTFGPGKGAQHTGYTGMKARIVRAAIDREPLVIDNPDVLDDVVYNADVGRAHVLAAFAPTPDDWRFNISGGRLVSLREWTEEVMRVCPEHRLSFGGDDPARLEGTTQGRLDITRAREQLGYEPAFPGAAGVADYVERERSTTPS